MHSTSKRTRGRRCDHGGSWHTLGTVSGVCAGHAQGLTLGFIHGFLDANDLVLLTHEVTRERVDLEQRLELADVPEEERERLRGLAPGKVFEIEVGWYVSRKPGL